MDEGLAGRGSLSLSLFLLLVISSLISAKSLYDPSDPILELDNDTFNSSVYGQKRAFFIEFYSSWCGACIGYAPTFKKFARQLESWSPIVQVTVVNCAEDKNMPLCREHQIAAFPTLKYFKYNSRSAEDATIFTGDKHDLPYLPFSVAQLVHDNWKTERPAEWPSFEAIAPSTTVREIWSAAETANLVAVVSQEEPSLLAWALTINYAGDKRVRTAIARPDHVQIVKEVGSSIDGKVLVYDKSGQRPVFISPEKPSFTDAQEKISEFLQQAIGDSLDKGAAAPGSNAQAPPPPGPPGGPPGRVVTSGGQKQHDPAVLADLSQYQMQLVDVESAIAYMLTREIPRRSRIEGEDLTSLKDWMGVMAKYAPGRTPTRRLLYRLNEWIQSKFSVTADDWMAQVASLQMELGNPLPAEITWLACRGSSPNLRGYTCGLWTLGHAVTVEAYTAEKNNLSFNSVHSVLSPFRHFIVRFLSCGECAANFAKEAEKHNLEAAIKSEDMVMWLWNTHNSVNTRLSGAPAEDPKHPKRTFPPKEICRQCWRSDGSVDQDATLQFLVNYYGNVKNDPVKPDPEYTVKTFQDGKVVEAEKRHFNPRFGVNGAEKVDKLERAEQRLQLERATLDTAPLRSGRELDDFKNELLGSPSSSRGNSQFLLISLSIIAFLVILGYCKYRRNRSKFWKTFYYSNDFKLPWHSDPVKQYTA
ncbi:hypothetical protein PFISCL1PPCAC_24848 [Pristionchus fissidentatus]|uniref:Sulfhydryl oxidase n=1 Tax=Pristionchus fissidentatus TaxID=1538716 RepID=A0AAV5WNH5_9BILA|nr:hypothetical protein PFISCL1PPCAC_24848 [Pristionchus fissidentatus]